MGTKSLKIFVIFSLLYIFIGFFLLDGGLVLISVTLTSSYVLLSHLVPLLAKRLNSFWTGFVISVMCLSSPLVLVELLRYYTLCR